MKYLAALLGLALAVGLTACDKTDDARCSELDEVISAKAAQFPRFCEDDVDCLVVEVHAGLSVASNDEPVDAELEAIKARRVELCGAFDDDFTNWEARCEDTACEIVAAGVVDRPDIGGDVDEGCATSQDCGPGSLCVAPECRPLCADACAHILECGDGEELGLGTSLENCIQRCDEFAKPAAEDGLNTARCLIRGACGNLAACF
jgi:hypothetical protein